MHTHFKKGTNLRIKNTIKISHLSSIFNINLMLFLHTSTNIDIKKNLDLCLGANVYTHIRIGALMNNYLHYHTWLKNVVIAWNN